MLSDGWVVALIGTDLDAEENEVDLSHARSYRTKAEAMREFESLANGRTNMDVVLLRVDVCQTGVLTRTRRKGKRNT